MPHHQNEFVFEHIVPYEEKKRIFGIFAFLSHLFSRWYSLVFCTVHDIIYSFAIVLASNNSQINSHKP